MRVRLLPQVLAVLTLGTLLASCATPAPPRADDTVPVDQRPAPPPGHVHGIGVNPADDRIYAATHNGLYVLDSNGARVVGESRSDFMGFTVLGPDVFVASGHPASDEAGPVSLGLIRSTDAGETWEEVALGGESDFHALTATGGRYIYGLDSSTGGIKVSTDDGETWDDGATIHARDIDADPLSSTTLLATTEDGLMVSQDAGATFEAAANQPPRPLPFVDHIPAGARDGATTLAGLDAEGTLWLLTNDTWTSAGPKNGTPEAFTALDADTYLAAFHGDVYRSSDGGATWHPVTAAGQ